MSIRRLKRRHYSRFFVEKPPGWTRERYPLDDCLPYEKTYPGQWTKRS